MLDGAEIPIVVDEAAFHPPRPWLNLMVDARTGIVVGITVTDRKPSLDAPSGGDR